MEIAVSILFFIPFAALCSAAALYLYKRNERENRRHLHDLSKEYDQQWEEFEVKHRKHFESDYWNTSVNKPEALHGS